MRRGKLMDDAHSRNRFEWKPYIFSHPTMHGKDKAKARDDLLQQAKDIGSFRLTLSLARSLTQPSSFFSLANPPTLFHLYIS
jgi:hypothetical protein